MQNSKNNFNGGLDSPGVCLSGILDSPGFSLRGGVDSPGVCSSGEIPTMGHLPTSLVEGNIPIGGFRGITPVTGFGDGVTPIGG